MKLVVWLTLAFWAGFAQGQPRGVVSIIPALPGGSWCTTWIELQNLSGRTAYVELEAHKPGGALAALKGLEDNRVMLGARMRSSYQLGMAGEPAGGWIAVREILPEEVDSPVVAVTGKVECLEGNKLVAVTREVAYPMKNPWFEGEAATLQGATIVMVNAAAVAARAEVCYSSGDWYSVPGKDDKKVQQKPLCQESQSALVAPFSSKEFAASRPGSTQFSLRTRGAVVVLQLVRPVEASVRLYRVDSSIQFGVEADEPR